MNNIQKIILSLLYILLIHLIFNIYEKIISPDLYYPLYIILLMIPSYYLYEYLKNIRK